MDGTADHPATGEARRTVALRPAPGAGSWWNPPADEAGAAPDGPTGRTGTVAWRRSGPWLHGALDLPDDGGDLRALARAAYRDVFAALREAGTRHLLRLWNYLPRIHDEEQGLERYRQFNAGRQLAFLDTGHDAFEGAPAACALGSHDGVLRIRVLAGVRAPLPVENPRQVSAYRYPTAYGPRSPTFSRAALVDLGDGRIALLVSGTASIVGHVSCHPGDVRAQTRETLRNLHALLQAAAERAGRRFDLRRMATTIYLRDPADQRAVADELAADLGAAAAPVRDATWLRADICRRDLLVEIEGHLVVDGALPVR